ncbi:hypothetical protein [Dyadobacter sp. LHD-138]|uniref:hypothetical protein n=1 Tax=Dyadobacter sp. LHD-138 TaxID=3071413 RepID=UPI0027E1D0CC|nr:hypothetical protein [Dyadobacter sp. LHD-138]MDQ6482246.1 hypothetical protein [Dyadobacter sp. LHD-138]
MDELVLQLLTMVSDEKKAAGIAPDHVTLSNLTGSIKQSLNRLYLDKKIRVGDTMNDKYITLL